MVGPRFAGHAKHVRCSKETGGSPVNLRDGVIRRLLVLYGTYALVNNLAYLLGYYLLPIGLLRGGPAVSVVESADSFGGTLALTLLFNLGLVALVGVGVNLFRVKGVSVGYLYPVFMGTMAGLVTGTDSFAAADAMQMPLREGMAAGLSIGGAEMLGYICVIAATMKFGVYEYPSWFRGKALKTGRIRDVRLDRSEISTLALGVVLLVVGAVLETQDAWRAL